MAEEDGKSKKIEEALVRDLSLSDVRVFGIETYSFCNRHCDLCPRTEMPPNRFRDGNRQTPVKEFLEDKYVYAILEQLAKMNFAGRVQMFNLNEPLYDPRIPVFIKFAYERNLDVRITTNGDPLRKKPALSGEILPYIKELSIGIYDYVPGRVGWEEKRNTLVEEWRKTLKQQGIAKLTVRYSLKEKFTRPPRNLDSGFSINAPCKRVRDGVYVLYNGKVVHCCKDNFEGTVFGNIKEAPLKEILASDTRRFVLETLEKGERWRFASCRDCLDGGIAEEGYANHASRDRDGEIIRLGRKYGLTRYPQPDTSSGWKAKDYLSRGAPSPLQVIEGRNERFCFGDGRAARQTPSMTPLPAATANTPFRFIVPQNLNNQAHRRVHEELVQLTERNYKPGLPKLLLIGERRLFSLSPMKKKLFSGAQKSVIQHVYEKVSGCLNVMHYPLTIGNIVAANKHAHLWALARPDVFVYCMGINEARRSLATGKPNVDIDTFAVHLESLFRRILEGETTSVILVTPLPVTDPHEAGKQWGLENEALADYSEAALDVAQRCGTDGLDPLQSVMAANKTSRQAYGRIFVDQVCQKLREFRAEREIESIPC